MTTTTFDTLRYAKKLQELGFTREQAEGFAELQSDLLDSSAATKSDIRDLKQEIREMEMRLTIRFGGMLAASVAIVATLVKLL